jgi:hypothetical protein
MSSDLSSGIRSAAKRTLAALAVLAVVGLAARPAFADIDISYTASADSMTNSAGPTAVASDGSGTYTVANTTLGNFTYSISSSPTDSGGVDGQSILQTTTIDLSAKGSTPTPDTITISLTGQGFTAGGTGEINQLSFSVTGSSSKYTKADTTTGSSYASNANVAFGMTTNGGSLTGAPTTGASTTYSFPAGGSTPVNFTKLGGAFSLTQMLKITLGAGDHVQLTITTSAIPSGLFTVPEPSTMALASLGALGLIGYGLRRRKALVV